MSGYCHKGKCECELVTIYNDGITTRPTKCTDEGCPKLTRQQVEPAPDTEDFRTAIHEQGYKDGFAAGYATCKVDAVDAVEKCGIRPFAKIAQAAIRSLVPRA